MSLNFIKNTAFYSSAYQFLCLGCIFVLVFNKVFSTSFLDVSLLRHFVRTICYVLAAVNLVVFIKEKNYKICLIFLSCLFVGFLCKQFSSSNQILYFCLFTFAFAKVNYRKAVFVFIITVSICILTIVTTSCLELLNAYSFRFRDGELRNAFGFRHPNALGGIVFFLIMTIWTYSKNCLKNDLLFILILIIASCFIGTFVDSRTAQYMCIFASIIITSTIALNKLLQKELFFSSSLVKWLLRSSFLVIALITFELGYLYSNDSQIFVFINDLLSGRLSLSKNAIINFSITPFGQVLKLSDLDSIGIEYSASVSYQVLDSFYMSVIFNYGIVGLLIYCFMYDLIMKKAIINRDKKLIITLFCFAIYGISESFVGVICFNIFLYLSLSYHSQRENIDSKLNNTKNYSSRILNE